MPDFTFDDPNSDNVENPMNPVIKGEGVRSSMIPPSTASTPNLRLLVLGVGGGGGNAVNRMIEKKKKGVEFIVANTDLQALATNKAPTKIQLGKVLTQGLGAGADPEVGRKSAEESAEEIAAFLTGANMVFITAGMGGGTGTGAAPVIARIARELGLLTVGIVTEPFNYERGVRKKVAKKGIEELHKHVDTLLVIPNERVRELAPANMPAHEAYSMVDKVLNDAVQGISDVINIPGNINVDYADVKTVMKGKGLAMMGIGRASGEGRAKAAADAAIHSKLLDPNISIYGSQYVLVNITGSHEVTFDEYNQVVDYINEEIGGENDNVNLISGLAYDDSLDNELQVAVIATGFEEHLGEARPENPHAAARVRSIQDTRSRSTGVLHAVSSTGEQVRSSKPSPRRFSTNNMVSPIASENSAASIRSTHQEQQRTTHRETGPFLRPSHVIPTPPQQEVVKETSVPDNSGSLPDFLRKNRFPKKKEENDSPQDE